MKWIQAMRLSQVLMGTGFAAIAAGVIGIGSQFDIATRFMSKLSEFDTESRGAALSLLGYSAVVEEDIFTGQRQRRAEIREELTDVKLAMATVLPATTAERRKRRMPMFRNASAAFGYATDQSANLPWLVTATRVAPQTGGISGGGEVRTLTSVKSRNVDPADDGGNTAAGLPGVGGGPGVAGISGGGSAPSADGAVSQPSILEPLQSSSPAIASIDPVALNASPVSLPSTLAGSTLAIGLLLGFKYRRRRN
jgi:hypothetical protein